MKLVKICVQCGVPHKIIVDEASYFKWRRGEAHIQDAMPDVSAEDREMLMSGICPTCWDKLFGEE